VRESQGELMKRRRDEAMKKLQPTEAA